jgi:hypothetical protein
MRITRLWKRLSRSIAPDPTSPLGVATERVGQEIGRTSVFAQSEDDTLALTVPVLGAPGKPHALDTAVTFRVFSGTSGTIPAPPAAQETDLAISPVPLRIATPGATLSRSAGPCAQETNVTLDGWAFREMATWQLGGLDRKRTYALFEHINKTCDWAILYKFENNQVSVLPKPEGAQKHVAYDIRGELYLIFFRNIMKLLPRSFSTIICMTVHDVALDSDVPVFSFQKRFGKRNPLLPDIDFLDYDFYEDGSSYDKNDYSEKLPGAVFSGSTTGGAITPAVARALALPRLRAAAFFAGHPRVDFRLPSIVQVSSPEALTILQAEPFCQKSRLEWNQQLQLRFIISMDGNGACCSRVVRALLSNSILLKYDSDNILYYFSGLQPWVHYIPIAEDRDVERIIEFESRYSADFEQIAAASRHFASTYLNRDSVYRYTAKLLLLYEDCFAERSLRRKVEHFDPTQPTPR